MMNSVVIHLISTGQEWREERMPEIPAKPKWLMKRKEGGLKDDA